MTVPRVLIVEDEFLIRLTLVEALQEDGFDVIESGTADEALSHIDATAELDLLLTDIQLPGSMSGLELVEAARLRRPGLPVIYMTGRPNTMAGTPTTRRDVFIAKPYLPSEVCALARKMVDANI